MRKLLSMFLAGVLLLCSDGLAAENITDFSALDDSALVELLNLVQQEIATRRIEKPATLMAGTYIVGKDIPAGYYRLHGRYESSYWSNVSVKDQNGGEKFSGRVLSASNSSDILKVDGWLLVGLSEGDILECDEAIMISVFTGVQFP